MEKISAAEVSQLTKLAAENLRSLSVENQDLKTKLATFQKKDHAEKIATKMEEKGLETGLSFSEKVASLMRRDDLQVIEEAVGMTAPQMKLASVHNGDQVQVEGGLNDDSGRAEASFFANLASM